jgi:hypothetical protein
MVKTRSTSRKAADSSPGHVRPLAKKARSSKDVAKLQQLLENMDINKRPRTSRSRKAGKGASRTAEDVTPGRQAPHNSPNTCSRSFSVDFESFLPPSPAAICAASSYTPILANSPVSVPADIQSTPSDLVGPHLCLFLCDKRGSRRLQYPQAALPVPAPPWMSTPPISQYTLESVISKLEGCNIDQLPTTSEATGPEIMTRWLPPATAAEEPENGSYDMSILEDALDDCGRVPQDNEYVSFGYHPEPQPRVVYRRPVIDYSSCPYAPPPLEVGKVKRLRKYKVCHVATLLVIIY